MKIRNLAWMFLAATTVLAGCKGFWSAPTDTSFTLSNSGNISVTPGATSGNTSTITVTPGSSFTGTVALTCSVTSTPSSATSPATCSLSTSSLTFSSSTAQTSTLTATTTSSTTVGTYDITVTGTSSGVSATTNLCAQVSSSSSTCTSSSGSSSGVFYVLNYATKQVAAYSISSGTLAQVGSAPTFLSAPSSIAIDPHGHFLYVGTVASGIFLFNIGSDGALTLSSSGTISQDAPASMQVDSTGSWLVESFVTSTGVQLSAIPINSSTGSPSASAVSTQFSGTTVNQLAISPDNSQVFVALGTAGTEKVTFTAGNTNPFGSVANIAVRNSAGGAVSVAVDPSSRLLYIGEVAATSGTNTGGLRVINYSTLINNNIVAEVSGSPFATGGLGPYAIVPTSYGASAGKYVFVANRTVTNSSTGNIAGFSVSTSGTTSTLTSLGTVASTGIKPWGMVQESNGNYILVVNSGGSPDLAAYTIGSGSLTSALTGSTGTDPVQAIAIAAAP